MTTHSTDEGNGHVIESVGNGSHQETKGFDDNRRISTGGTEENGPTQIGNHEEPVEKTGFEYRMSGREGPMGSSFIIREDEQVHSADGHNLGLEIGYLPPDQRPGLPAELLAQLVDPEIEEDTEAAEALRANAQIKVPKVGKVARSINAQSVRKLMKRATGRSKSGNLRGKPPRIPPGRTAVEDPDDLMYVVEEGEEEYSDDGEQEEESENGSVESMTLNDVVEPRAGDSKQSPEDHKQKSVHHKSFAHKSFLHKSFHHQPKHSRPVTFQEPISTQEGDGRHKKGDKHGILDEAKDIPAEVVAATMEAGKKFLGAVDPHNMLQLQRWRRKKKNAGKKSRKSYVKGKVIDGKHELYTLSIAVMLGVRTSIAKTNSIITSGNNNRRMLVPQDFMAEEKYEFAPKGSPNTPPHKLSHTFKFKDYAPMAFAYLRRMFGVNEFDFLLSVCGNANFIEFISNAKSGQFFFYSSDGKYMIKTMTNDESKFLRRILPHYFQHCTHNPNTLITKFLGMYRVKLYHLRRNVKFVIMNSVYHTDKYLQTFFDLKGSELGRDAKPGQDVLKDNDLRRKLPGEALSLRPEIRTRIREQVVADCTFLQNMKIMDYSMLIGIHHIPVKQGAVPGSIAKTGFRIKERQGSQRFHQRSFSHDPSMMASIARFDTLDDHSHGASSDGPTTVSRHSFTSNEYPEMKQDRMKMNESKILKEESTRRFVMDTNSCSVADFQYAGLLEEDDDCSYLEGSDARQDNPESQKALKMYQQHPRYDDIELKKEQTIEQIYWPFHRYFDINGLRRMKPKPCYRCSSHPCKCEGHLRLRKAWKIPDFEPPLSNRKDGGFIMDTTNLDMPMTFKGPTGDRPYDGKIFYLGIIDILQQYNVRKRVETNYRKVEGFNEPSCVHPDVYAERFIRFFDEYSAQCAPAKKGEWKKTVHEEEKTSIELSIPDGVVQVNVISKDK